MQVLAKGTIKEEIEKYLSIVKRGFEIKVLVYQIVELILCKLKTGCQWKFLPVGQFVIEKEYFYYSVYYYYNKWSKDGSWKNI